MELLNQVLSIVSGAISLLFAAVVLVRYVERRQAQLLWWGAGLLMAAIAILAQAYHASFGWNPTVYRLWYLFGAILAAAWLGQGTLQLLLPRRFTLPLGSLLIAVSLIAALLMLLTPLDPAQLTGGELTGRAVLMSAIRFPLTVVMNIYGTAALAGGALYSAWVFWRQRTHFHRMIGCILLAAGAFAFALGGTFSRFGISGLYLSQLIGTTALFVGFLFTLRPATAGSRGGLAFETRRRGDGETR